MEVVVVFVDSQRQNEYHSPLPHRKSSRLEAYALFTRPSTQLASLCGDRAFCTPIFTDYQTVIGRSRGTVTHRLLDIPTSCRLSRSFRTGPLARHEGVAQQRCTIDFADKVLQIRSSRPRFSTCYNKKALSTRYCMVVPRLVGLVGPQPPPQAFSSMGQEALTSANFWGISHFEWTRKPWEAQRAQAVDHR